MKYDSERGEGFFKGPGRSAVKVKQLLKDDIGRRFCQGVGIQKGRPL